MQTQHRTFLREVMTLAWRRFRFNGGAFASHLRDAWAWIKGAAARDAAAARYAAAPNKRTVAIRSMLQSPIRRSLTGQAYADTRAREAGYYTSMVGG